MEPDAALEREVGQVADRVDGAIAVVAGRSNQCDGLVVDVVADPVHVDLGRDGVDRRPPQLDPEEMARLVEGGVGGLGLDHVRLRHTARLGGVLAVGEDRVQDAAGPAGGHQPAGVVTCGHRGVAGVKVERHGDDLRLELGRARAHVALQDVHMGEKAERLVHEVVVVVVAAVHRARALARLPEGVLLRRHGAELGEHLVPAHALGREHAVDGEAVGVGVVAHRSWPPRGGGHGRRRRVLVRRTRDYSIGSIGRTRR